MLGGGICASVVVVLYVLQRQIESEERQHLAANPWK